MQYPTIRVKNFARIEEAEIELAPLTLFVGDNNSGKSYLSSLLWGFSRPDLLERILFDPADFDKHEIKWNASFKHWIEETVKNESGSKIPFTTEIHQFFCDEINKRLNHEKSRLCEAIFGRHVNIGHLELDLPFNDKSDISLSVHLLSLRSSENKDDTILADVWVNNHLWPIQFSQGLEKQRVVQSIYHGMLATYLWSHFHRASFLPASRTGFLLTYRSLTEISIENNFLFRPVIKKEEGSQLTLPQVSFLQSLGRKAATKPSKPWIALSEFIEERLIHGSLTLNDLPLPDFSYRPEGLEDDLPMFLSSGVVTEVAPLLAQLKYNTMVRRCVIEEPEMSLHPKLQWRMAQVLIRLSKLIASVLVTTHSDTIIQHVNNMIKLANRKDGKTLAKEHGYTDEDIISADRVRMYQFDADEKDHKTRVTLLEHGKNGFAVPTFGDTLRELRNDVVAFHHDDEELPKPKKPARRKESRP